jgi:hypothetical protein
MAPSPAVLFGQCGLFKSVTVIINVHGTGGAHDGSNAAMFRIRPDPAFAAQYRVSVSIEPRQEFTNCSAARAWLEHTHNTLR